MTHATFDEESMRAAGIGGGLVRLSAGIEATEDLVSDVLRGLDAVSNSA